MRLDPKKHAPYIQSAQEMEREFLADHLKSVTRFGVLEEDELAAVGSVKCYMGHWYLRTCVVRADSRGKGYQRQLIRERLHFLDGKTDLVRVSIAVSNNFSIRNVLAEGFEFEKYKYFDDLGKVGVYRFMY